MSDNNNQDPLAAAGGGVGAGLGSVLGYFMGQGDRNAAGQDYKNIINTYGNTQAATAGPSAYNSISVDPATRAAQLEALGQMQTISQDGGLDPLMRSKLNAADESNALQARAQQGQIQNSMAQQGLASSGANIAAQQQAGQQAAQNDYNAGIGAAGLGAERQMAAIQGAAGLAGGMRGQDYQQAADRAGANDAISRFNASQTQQNNQFKATGQAGGYDKEAGWNAGLANQQQQLGYGVGGGLGAGAGQALSSTGALAAFM